MATLHTSPLLLTTLSAVGSGSGATLTLNVAPSAWPDGAFVPGDALRGRVTFERTTPVTVRAVCLQLQGVVEAKFEQRSDKRREILTQTGEVCESRLTLLDNGGAVSMGRGLDSYEFVFQVPPNLPPSFKGAHGFVKYRIMAYVRTGQTSQRSRCCRLYQAKRHQRQSLLRL